MPNRSEDVNAIVISASTTAAIAGAANPVPFIGDGLILVTAWVAMLGTLAAHHDIDFEGKSFRILAFQIFKSIIAYAAGTLSFIYLLKFTGGGTIIAAILNATLNFGFTMVVGYMYSDAWERNEEPTKEEVLEALKNVVHTAKDGFSKRRRKEMIQTYQTKKEKGASHSEAIIDVIKDFFEGFFD
ncbi:MAG: hypothetical protein AAF705_04505 [Bacteroidota bacterium]